MKMNENLTVDNYVKLSQNNPSIKIRYAVITRPEFLLQTLSKIWKTYCENNIRSP